MLSATYRMLREADRALAAAEFVIDSGEEAKFSAMLPDLHKLQNKLHTLTATYCLDELNADLNEGRE